MPLQLVDSLLLSYELWLGFSCFYESGQVAVRTTLALASKLFFVSIDLVVGFPSRQLRLICFDD